MCSKTPFFLFRPPLLVDSDKFYLFLTMPVCAKYMVYKKYQLMVKAAKHTTLSVNLI